MKSPGSSNILLVDGSARDADLTLTCLQKDGAPVRIAWLTDGQDALDYVFQRGTYVERIGEPLDLILLELNLHSMDGRDVLGKLKADSRTRRIPIVMLTWSREENDIVDCYDLGANGYVVKAAEPGDWFDMIERLGDYWLTANRGAFLSLTRPTLHRSPQ